MKTVNVNISEGGIRIIWDRPFVVGDYLEVRMLLRYDQEDLVILCGRVVWSEHIKGELYRVALEFPCRYRAMKRIITCFVLHKEREYRTRKIIGHL